MLTCHGQFASDLFCYLESEEKAEMSWSQSCTEERSERDRAKKSAQEGNKGVFSGL